MLYGVGSSYFHQITNGVLLRADGEFLSGKTQYKGGLQDANDGQYDYRRDINYYYVIYGLQFEALNNDRNILLVQVEVDNLVGGSVKTYLSDADSRYPDLDLQLRDGMAYKLGAEYYYNLANSAKILTEVSYKKWQVSESKAAEANGMYFVEPKNTTSLLSLTVGYLF